MLRFVKPLNEVQRYKIDQVTKAEVGLVSVREWADGCALKNSVLKVEYLRKYKKYIYI